MVVMKPASKTCETTVTELVLTYVMSRNVFGDKITKYVS
jgi:hypothetical protein